MNFLFGDDDDAEFGRNATVSEAELLKRHSSVRMDSVAASPRLLCSSSPSTHAAIHATAAIITCPCPSSMDMRRGRLNMR